MANKIDQGIHLLLTHDEAQAILRAMTQVRIASWDFDPSPEKKKLWASQDSVRDKIKAELLDSAEHAT